MPLAHTIKGAERSSIPARVSFGWETLQRVCVHLQRSFFSWTRLLINGGCRLEMTSSSGQQKWQQLHQVWLVYVQVWTGQSLKAEPDFISLPKLNTSTTPPLAASPRLPSPLSLVGHANLSLIRGPGHFGRLGCVSISKLMGAMCSQSGEKPASQAFRRGLLKWVWSRDSLLEFILFLVIASHAQDSLADVLPYGPVPKCKRLIQ